MAINYTTEFTTAVPYLSGSKVVEWDLGMTYTYGTSGASNFYQSEFNTSVQSS